MLNAIVILTAITQGLVGLFVYLKKRNSSTNIVFAILSLTNLAWAITNYVYTLNPVAPTALHIIRLVMFFVVVENTLFYIFAKNYPSIRQNIPTKRLVAYLIFSSLVALAAIGPFVFKSVTISHGQSEPNPGVLIPLFVLHAAYSIGAGMISLIHKLRAASGQLRKQFQYIIFASTLNWLVVPITNFVITLALHTSFFARVSPFYTLAFASIIAYTILAQRLFDIRAAVVRSVTYVLLLSFMATTYILALFGVVDVFFAGSRYATLRQILSAVLVVPLVLSFQSIKDFFNRVTNKIFFRDTYDTQVVLDELGSLLVAEIDLHKVLTGTRSILSTAIKCSFVEFILFEDGKPRLESTGNKVLQADLGILSARLRDVRRDVLDREELSLQGDLRQLLDKEAVAVSVRLKTQRQIVGYILFGDKRSGDIYNRQDLKLLAIVANELAVAVQNALRFEEIQRFNVTLQQKVDEATRELKRVNARLRELDKTKDEFISMASHQLRTPLTTVKGYLSMILDGDIGPVKKDQRELMQHAFDGANRMVYLIADLLNVSRLQTGKFVIDNKPTNLAEVIEGEISQLKEQVDNRQIELTYKKPHDFPVLNLDETKIRQVIMNFLDNALYYTPKGGKVNVALSATNDSVNYTVTDTGMGVPKSIQHHLFSKFFRADNAKKMRPDGTGLGLYMAKKVIVAQGGAVIFRSTEGKGSTFGFTFPRRSMEAKDHPAANKDDTEPKAGLEITS